MLDILEFTYLSSNNIDRAAQIIQLGPSAIKQLTERYVLLTVGVTYRHNVVIHEILYDDIMKNSYASKYYEELIKRYGGCNLDDVFPKDDKNIKKKIINTIYFALDKVYKCDKLLVTFEEGTDSMDNVLYHVLQEEFEIVSQETLYGVYHIIINRRKRQND